MLELRAQAFVVVDSDGSEKARAFRATRRELSVLCLDQPAVASLSSTQRNAIVSGSSCAKIARQSLPWSMRMGFCAAASLCSPMVRRR